MKTTNIVTLENTEEWIFHSSEMDYEYDIKVAFPKSPPPEEGYPVIYVLDGSSYFQFARDVVRLQSGNSGKTFVNPSIVVGIGHAGEKEEIRKRRFYDFTAPAKGYQYPERLKGREMGMHGGARKFLYFIEEELKEEIDRRYKIDQNNQTLFGHSLSGLFTLWTLFTKPAAFQTYLASSPSIWWNNYELLTYMEQFLQQTQPYEKRRLQITVGERERFMVDDAEHVANELTKMSQERLACEFYIAPEENHASVVPTIMSRAIRFACQ